MPRTNTPDVPLGANSYRVTLKRSCNGCDTEIGDATDEEVLAAMEGSDLPDVRHECPTCSAAS